MTISIADTSGGVFFFCDQGSAEALRGQIGERATDGTWKMPPGLYIVVLPLGAEVAPLGTTDAPPPLEIEQEVLREALARRRSR